MARALMVRIEGKHALLVPPQHLPTHAGITPVKCSQAPVLVPLLCMPTLGTTLGPTAQPIPTPPATRRPLVPLGSPLLPLGFGALRLLIQVELVLRLRVLALIHLLADAFAVLLIEQFIDACGLGVQVEAVATGLVAIDQFLVFGNNLLDVLGLRRRGTGPDLRCVPIER